MYKWSKILKELKIMRKSGESFKVGKTASDSEGMRKHAWWVGALAKRWLIAMAEREFEKLVRPDAKRVKRMADVGSGPLSLGAS